MVDTTSHSRTSSCPALPTYKRKLSRSRHDREKNAFPDGRHLNPELTHWCGTRILFTRSHPKSFGSTHQVEAEHLEQLSEESSLRVGCERRERTLLQDAHVLENHAQETSETREKKNKEGKGDEVTSDVPSAVCSGVTHKEGGEIFVKVHHMRYR